ncbi:MAG: YfhO family protein [Actinomycetaceae bacterium]|nr:YfhO family protein [Actinomycetaceae bacterium]
MKIISSIHDFFTRISNTESNNISTQNNEAHLSRFSISPTLKSKTPLRRLLLAYTVSFAAIAPLIFLTFWKRSISLIEHGDAWRQHTQALAYTGIYLRDLAHSWLHGNFSLPTFSTSFGYGSDVFTTLQYYTIGDPLTLLSIFVSPEHTEGLYAFLLILRFYLAGLSFALTIRYLRNTNLTGIILGSLAYAFSGWMLAAPLMHPYFANPLIYFPLVILGIEKAIREKKYVLLLGAITMSAIVNFYFFFMIALLTVTYVIVRLTALGIQHSWKESGHYLLRITATSILSLLLAAVFLLPIVISFLSSSRTQMPVDMSFLYHNGYYKKVYLEFVSLSTSPAGKYAYVYVSPLALLATLWLFVRRRAHWIERVLLFIAGIFFTFPFFGSLFNGMSYPTNRWSWVWAFLAAYLICVFWDEVWTAPRTEIRNLAILSGGYILIASVILHQNHWLKTFDVSTGFSFLIACIALLFYYKSGGSQLAAKTLLTLTTISAVVLTSYWRYEQADKTFIQHGLWKENLTSSDASVVSRHANIHNNKLARFETYPIEYAQSNTSILHGVSSSGFYWSIDSTNAREFYDSLGINSRLTYMRDGVDARSYLNAFLGIHYRIDDIEKVRLSGDKLIDTYTDPYLKRDLGVFENATKLPLGFTYSSITSHEDFEKLSLTEREELLLHSAVMNNNNTKLTYHKPHFGAHKIPYSLEPTTDSIHISDSSIETKKKNQEFILHLNSPSVGETHVEFKGMDVTHIANKKGHQNFKASFNCKEKDLDPVTLTYLTRHAHWFENRKNYLLNSGVCEKGIDSIRISIENAGKMNFDSLEVWNQPLEGFEEAVTHLSSESLENIDFHDLGLSRTTNEITGDITVSERKILALTIPKTNGWTAYIDGKEQEILDANLMWMGLELAPGHHDIRLVYHTPGLQLGAAISGTTALGLTIYWIIRRKRTALHAKKLSKTNNKAISLS